MAKAITANRMGGRTVVTGRPVTWRGPLLLLACVGVALLMSACQTVATAPDEPVATRPDEPLDPQALVGEWRGESVNHFDPSLRDMLVVTITRVEGDRVFGTFEQWSRGYKMRGRRTSAVEVTLHGHTLTLGHYDFTVVDGQRMTGHTKDAEAELTKSTPRQTPPVPGVAGSIDGVYTGSVCYGPSPNDPARCYQAKATVRGGTIVGEWGGRDGVTVKLAGEVSTLGAVKIEMHAERADGTQFARANLSGTIQNGRLDASGAFPNGRTLSFSWTLNAPGGDARKKPTGKP
jgi:hypothetical protein